MNTVCRQIALHVGPFAVVTLLSAGCGSHPDRTDGGGLLDAVDMPTTTRTFRQDVDGYHGTRSVGISTYSGLGDPGEYNANGMTFADGQNDWCTGIDIPGGAYSEVWLLRFEDLALPVGARIVDATLSIEGYSAGPGEGLFFAGSYLAAPWFGDTPTTCAGCSDSPVGWRYRDGVAAPWVALGASAEGGDVMVGKTFRLPKVGFVAPDSTPREYTTRLDPIVVQAWVAGENNGVRIVAGVPNVHMGYVQAQRDLAGRPVEMRPSLSIAYTLQ